MCALESEFDGGGFCDVEQDLSGIETLGEGCSSLTQRVGIGIDHLASESRHLYGIVSGEDASLGYFHSLIDVAGIGTAVSIEGIALKAV